MDRRNSPSCDVAFSRRPSSPAVGVAAGRWCGIASSAFGGGFQTRSRMFSLRDVRSAGRAMACHCAAVRADRHQGPQTHRRPRDFGHGIPHAAAGNPPKSARVINRPGCFGPRAIFSGTAADQPAYACVGKIFVIVRRPGRSACCCRRNCCPRSSGTDTASFGCAAGPQSPPNKCRTKHRSEHPPRPSTLPKNRKQIWRWQRRWRCASPHVVVASARNRRGSLIDRTSLAVPPVVGIAPRQPQ